LDRTFIPVEGADFPVVPSQIENHTVTDGAADQPCPGASRNHIHIGLGRGANERGRFPSAPGKSHGEGLNLVKGRVRRVKLTGGLVERDLALRLSESAFLCAERHRGSTRYSALPARATMELLGTTHFLLRPILNGRNVGQTSSRQWESKPRKGRP
jgi:hypothetical protein